MKKKVLSFLLAFVMIVGMMPTMALTVFAADETVEYRYSAEKTDGTGYYYADAEITDYEVIDVDHQPTSWDNGWYVVHGEVTISNRVKCNGDVHLILTDGCKLTVTENLDIFTDCSLTIYAQKGESGTLIAQNGIGSGSRMGCGDITVHGGIVTAQGNSARPAIGCGDRAAMGVFTLYGGIVSATGVGTAPAIGHFNAPSSGTVNFYGGKLTVKADEGTQAIKVKTITVVDNLKVKDVDGTLVTCPTGQSWAETLTGVYYFLNSQPVVEFRYYDETEKKFLTGECDEYTVVTKDTTDWTEGWYVVNENVTIDGEVTISGSVNLILCDGKTLTVNGDINGKGTFSVYAQSFGTNSGSLDVGANSIEPTGSITVHGGNVTSTKFLSLSSITVTGGNVSVTGRNGIDFYAGDGISISGGDVTVKYSGFGIYSHGKIEISGGDVTVSDGIYGIFSWNFIEISGGNVNVTANDCGIRSADMIILAGTGDVTAQGSVKAIEAGESGIIVDYSTLVYNQANERVTLPKFTAWEEILNDKYYRFIEKDSLALKITDNSFTVTASGKDADTGIVMVALYNNGNMKQLIDVKLFDLSKTNVLQGTFTQSGYVKAFWWSNFETMMPLCNSAAVQ